MALQPLTYQSPGTFQNNINWTPLQKMGDVLRDKRQQEDARQQMEQYLQQQQQQQQQPQQVGPPMQIAPQVQPSPLPPVPQTPLGAMSPNQRVEQGFAQFPSGPTMTPNQRVAQGFDQFPNGGAPFRPNIPVVAQDDEGDQPDQGVMDRYKRATSSIESGSPQGNYSAVGPATKSGDRAFGRYQVMGDNVPDWTEKYYGKRLTPSQFLADPKAQDAVYEGEFGRLAQKYGPTGAAKAWFAGEKGMNNPNASDGGTTVQAYADQFNRNLGGLPPEIAQGQSQPPAQQVAQQQAPQSSRDAPPLDPHLVAGLYANPLTRPYAMALLKNQIEPDEYQIEKITTPEGNTQLVRVKKRGEEGPIDLGGGTGADSAGSDLTGDEFLATKPPAQASLIKAIAEGRMQPPAGYAQRSPKVQQLLRDVAQYDPGFDLTLWKSRNDTLRSATSGKIGQNVASFNTAIGHLDTLDQSIDALGNTSFTPYNRAANAARATYDPDFASNLRNFEASKTAVIDELTRAFRGTGGNVHDLQQWEENINSADSPQALHSAVRRVSELLHSRIDALGDQYNRGMQLKVPKDSTELLSPKAKDALDRIEGGAKAKQGAAAGGIPRVTTDAERDALPSGRLYIGPDGQTRRKR
jgi:hypothetical protein